MRDIELNGARLKVLDRGSGPPIVFVHGAVADYRVWEAQVKTFAQDYRVLAYSLRHHFPNAPDGVIPRYDTPLHADDLAALLRVLGLGPVHLVGHSYGGRVAALTALQNPELIRSLVLAEPSIFSFLPVGSSTQAALAVHHTFADHLLVLAERSGPEAAAGFIDAMAAPRAFAEFPERLQTIVRANAHTLRPLLLARVAEPAGLFQKLPQLRAPVLVIEGELSPRLFKLAVAGICRELPRAKHEIMRGVAHGLHLEAPRYFSDLLRRFLCSV